MQALPSPTHSFPLIGCDVGRFFAPPSFDLSKKPIVKPNSLALPVPVLRVEQLREGRRSPGFTSPSDSEFSEFSDSEVISRLGEFVPPSDEHAKEIAKQMDYYFSDENILKDSFLLKHARRNKDGNVNLKLITSFKKMKTLTKDYRQVAFSLRKYSTHLQVNPEGNKVRRTIPLPEHDETKMSRTVIAVNLEDSNLQSITELFKPCGEIVMLQILKPGKPIPPEIKKHLLKHPFLKSVTCAIIEFEKHEEAADALALSTLDEDWEYGLKVMMMPKSPGKHGEDSDTDSDKNQRKPNTRKKLRHQIKSLDYDRQDSGSEGEFLMPRPQQRTRNGSFDRSFSPTYEKQTWPCILGGLTVSNNLNQRRRSMPLPTSPLVENAKPFPQASSPKLLLSPKISPENQRRGSACLYIETIMERSASPSWRSFEHSRENSPGRGVTPFCIIRQPRGPELGKGFNQTRSKINIPSITLS